MPRVVTLPPAGQSLADGAIGGGWWHSDEAGRIVCDLCPRECHLKPGDRGFCFVRENREGEMVLSTYGRSTGFCVDPIEKKPLNHFYPGTSVLSFGTAGCNLGCKFCQNWDISKSREVARLSEDATPDDIASAAARLGCRSVAFTYNDPVIWAEYAMDVAQACRQRSIQAVAVTAGYITPAARAPFFHAMDAANVDLKAFSDDFYQTLTASHLQPVLDTLHWLKHESDVWFEITNLIIPDANDRADELRQMCDWILQHVGDEVPLHFTAFHPDFRLRDRPPTPHETLLGAYELAARQGVKYVYLGNVNDTPHQSTYCPQCRQLLIQRNWHQLGVYQMKSNRCGHCGGLISGHFDQAPGQWGRKRLPVQISHFRRASNDSDLAEREATMATPPRPETSLAQDSGPQLTRQQERAIHQAACEAVAAQVHGRTAQFGDPTISGAARVVVMGSFVTLKRQGRLRACCGFLGRPMAIAEAVGHAAVRTATEDNRLPPVSPSELRYLDLDVTLLFAFQPVTARGQDRLQAVEIGRHGLQIQRGEQSGLLLPSVAAEHGMDAEEFLRQVCRKAGLPSNAWQAEDAKLVTFEGCSIHGAFDVQLIGQGDDQAAALLNGQELAQLAEHCRTNVIAQLRRATPNYYLPSVSDGTVQGAALTVHVNDRPEPLRFGKFAMRPGLPLQSTLFNLTEAAANALQSIGMGELAEEDIRAGITVLADASMHGSVEQPDLRGVDPGQRAVLVVENTKSAWVFDPERSAEQLLRGAAQAAQVTMAAASNVFSLAALSTEPSLTFSSVPRPAAGPQVRPPAVAGTFYPASVEALDQLLDQLLENEPPQAQPWPAAMVPHAGLVYSGRIAAAVLQRIQIPDTVIVIGPKHTRLGVEWAVAPHQAWSIPGATVESDVELARQLADSIDRLELDAAAHQGEHAVEVELPLLARLAPNTRVVGIALGSGNLQRCRKFALQLAKVVQSMSQPPLLLISSDMNHYATDAENRRLDELALTALSHLDPEELYRTISRHNISMCGVLPAVIVMETLRQLGKLQSCQRVAYATSADVTGDARRVVGYAGVLLG